MATNGKKGIIGLIVLTTLLCGCGKPDYMFQYEQNESGQLEVVDDSYISYEDLSNYYVVETYNKISNESKIYIAWGNRYFRRYSPDYTEYVNIFNNKSICFDDNQINDNIEFVNAMKLEDFLITYDFIKYNYSYEDVLKLYDIIIGNYEITRKNADINFGLRKSLCNNIQ